MSEKVANIVIANNVPQEFNIPNGFTQVWENEDGRHEGNLTVYDTNLLVYARLVYENEKLNSICRFYENGCLSKKITYANGIADGWGCEYKKMKEVKWFMYKNGKKVREYIRFEKRNDYWKEVSCETNCLLSLCQYDEHLRHNKCYYFGENGHISKIVEYNHGEEVAVKKTFENDVMTEFDEEGNKVYKGSYEDSFDSDYCRDGKGIEWVNDALIYCGEWKSNKRNGEGVSYMNGDVFYDGEWMDGSPNGYGYVCSEGELKYEGEWRKGILKLNEKDCYDYSQNKVVTNFFIQKSVRNSSELQQLLKDENLKRNVRVLVIESGCGNDISSVTISGFDWLERLSIRNYALQRVNQLVIKDNNRLTSISVDGGGSGSNASCYYVKGLEILSIHLLYRNAK